MSEFVYEPRFAKPERKKKEPKPLKSSVLAKSGPVKKSKRKREAQAEVQEFVNAAMARVKRQPCFVRGTRDAVEVAHISLPIRQGLIYQPRIERTLDRTRTSHHGKEGLFCIPLEWELHSEQSPYPYSFHKIGQEAFFTHHELSAAEVFAFVAINLAELYLEGWNA